MPTRTPNRPNIPIADVKNQNTNLTKGHEQMKELTTSNAISMTSESAHCGDMTLKTPKDYRVITAAHALLNASMIAYWGGDQGQRI